MRVIASALGRFRLLGCFPFKSSDFESLHPRLEATKEATVTTGSQT